MTVIIDSNTTLEDALSEKEMPDEIRNSLALITFQYAGFDGLEHRGQLVVHKKVTKELEEIFKILLEKKFPIEKAVPVSAYAWDDDASMADNNTSAFNYRLVHGTNQLSNHSYGLAVDINPALNPYVRRDGSVMPPGAQYDTSKPGTLTPEIVSVFTTRGWEWGGDWERKDWQHFQKR